MNSNSTTIEGRELDAAVAVEILGWRWMRGRDTDDRLLVCPEDVRDFREAADGTEPRLYFWDAVLPYYSTSKHEWLDVVAKLEADGYEIQLHSWPGEDGQRFYDCAVNRRGARELWMSSKVGFAESICHAALHAVREMKAEIPHG